MRKLAYGTKITNVCVCVCVDQHERGKMKNGEKNARRINRTCQRKQQGSSLKSCAASYVERNLLRRIKNEAE